MSGLTFRVGMTSVLMSAIGLPVCLSHAPQPTSPPASRLASKSHSSVKRLRKMAVKGSSCSHTRSGLCSAASKSCCLSLSRVNALLSPPGFSAMPTPPPSLACLLSQWQRWPLGTSLSPGAVRGPCDLSTHRCGQGPGWPPERSPLLTSALPMGHRALGGASSSEQVGVEGPAVPSPSPL